MSFTVSISCKNTDKEWHAIPACNHASQLQRKILKDKYCVSVFRDYFENCLCSLKVTSFEGVLCVDLFLSSEFDSIWL